MSEIEAKIEAAKTPKGGWNKESFALLGIEYPPKKGWRKRLVQAVAKPQAAKNDCAVFRLSDGKEIIITTNTNQISITINDAPKP